jgi:golgin subfamily B member 1
MQKYDENSLSIPLQEIQQERDILQERMSDQLMKISSLQSRLDEQRIRAEELNKQNTSDLQIRCHDLQNELGSLRETLTARDKQISNLNQLLEHSKKIIDRQEHELAFSGDNDKSLVDRLEDELKRKADEIQRLKEKIKSEMINKVALPDLMETMMAEKNEEIDALKEQLMMFQGQEGIIQQTFVKANESSPPASSAGGTILSMISEYDEPDMLRKMADQQMYQVRSHLQLDSFPNPRPLPATTKTRDLHLRRCHAIDTIRHRQSHNEHLQHRVTHSNAVASSPRTTTHHVHVRR